MRYAIASITALTVALSFTACASSRLFGGGEKKGTVVLYRDEANACKSITTPYFKAFKSSGKVKWKIDDEFECITGDLKVILKFDKGDADPLPSCLKEGTNKIECDLDHITAPIPKRKYSVWLGGTKLEDPELQIEM